MENDYYMSCHICGFESDNENMKFHRMKTKNLDSTSNEILIDICDICHNLHGAWTEYHHKETHLLSYMTFVQGLHYIVKKINE